MDTRNTMTDTLNKNPQSCTVSDTPETDGEWNRIACYDHPHFENALAEFTRKLERERDELKADNKHFENQNKVLTVQRDEALFDLAFSRDLYKLQESQLDELRKQLAEAINSCHIWQSGHSALVRDRDEALWERDQLTNKIAAEREGWKAIAVELEKQLAIVTKQNNERLTLLQENGLAEYGN